MSEIGRKKINWRALGEIVAVLAVVVSLAFLAYEIRLSREEMLVARDEVRAEQQMIVRDMIAENADLWARGCLGEELTPVEELVFVQILTAIQRRSFVNWQHAQSTNNDPIGFTNSIALSMIRFPGFESRFLAQAKLANSAGGGPFLDAILENYDYLVESDVEKNAPVWLCGR